MMQVTHAMMDALVAAQMRTTLTAVCCIASFCCLQASGAEWRLELSDGATAEGSLERLTREAVEITSEGSVRRFPVEGVRSLARKEATEAAGGGPTTRSRPVRARLVDGSWFDGDDVVVNGRTAEVRRDDTRIELPSECIVSLEYGRQTATEPPPAWLGRAADGVNDVVVVRGLESPEFVECAIESVSADAVTVVLDEETIPVKRSKVVGLKWHRAPPPDPDRTATVVVDIDGGRVRATSVEIADGFLLSTAVDGGMPRTIRIPVGWLDRIDYADGRRIALVSSEPDRLDFEPWFGIFKTLDGVSNHFKPRRTTVPSPDGRSREALLVKPRTVISWRLPSDAKRVSLTASGGNTSASTAAGLVVALDDREIFRGAPLESVPIEAEIGSARRLTITVDYPRPESAPSGIPGGEVLLIDPAVER